MLWAVQATVQPFSQTHGLLKQGILPGQLGGRGLSLHRLCLSRRRLLLVALLELFDQSELINQNNELVDGEAQSLLFLS